MSQNEFQPQNNNSELAEYNKHWFPLFIAIFVALVVDGMDLQLLNLCLPVLKEDFAVTQIQIGALSSYTLLGMGIGGLMAGMLADRIGRVKVTIASLVMFSVFTACLAFTHSYWQFAVVRFFSGFGIAALYAIGTLLVAEYVPTDKRSTILGTLQAGWSIGYVCAALLSAAILPSYGWRPLFIITIIPALISFLILRKIKEPASFTASKKKQKNKENEYAKIFRNKSVRTVFLLWAVANIALQFGYYGANTWVPSYLRTDLGMDLKNMSLYVAGTYTAMIAGKILAGMLADRFGRKSIWMIGGVATAIAMPCIMSYANTSNVIYLMIMFGFLYAIPYALLSTYMSESFPVDVRGTAVATMSSIGKIGSISAPIFVGFMATQYSIGFGIALLGIAYAICALVPGLFIKEKMYDPSAM
ncbi:MAG TPA: MFS transporter [Lachnospiraceae bacterium]|jgi:AAHS family cis,cis-muconate transporter-like MFS transporter|nr:MFS transporter [Lachnospiraceae bacterium]